MLVDKGYHSKNLHHDCLDGHNALQGIPDRLKPKDPTAWKAIQKAYKGRNSVERLFAKVKDSRGLETRHGKLGEILRGLIRLVLEIIHV